MTDLNYRTDYLHQTPERVAEDFLKAKGLLKPSRNGNAGIVRIGSKIFGEQYILASMYTMLIKGYKDYDVATKTGLGGTKICFDAITNNQIDLYPEYTGTGLLAILNASPETVKLLHQNTNSVYNYVSNQFKQKYNLVWLKPIGFNNAYALMMRRKQSDQLNIRSISELTNYVDKQK